MDGVEAAGKVTAEPGRATGADMVGYATRRFRWHLPLPARSPPPTPMKASQLLHDLVVERLSAAARTWFAGAVGEVAGGASDARFCALFSMASRHAGSGALEPDAGVLAAADGLVAGWNLERWTRLEALRVALLLASPGLEGDAGPRRVEELFRYADEGELCALERSLALLPGPERFAWRAGEGCRSNMRSVFEAAALDTPFPLRHFDDVAWNQAVIKCLFVGAPLWRLYGLDERLSPELARMALDLADERRSAGRPVPHELWLCLGRHGGERGRRALEQELHPGASPRVRAAVAVAFARAGDSARPESFEEDPDPLVRAALEHVRAGETASSTFRFLA